MSFVISDGGHYEWYVTNNGIPRGPGYIISGTVTDAVYQGISVGNVISRQLSLQMYDVSLDPTDPIVLSVKAIDNTGAVDGTYAKGTYYIDTIEKSPYSDVVSITAFDALLKTETPYMKSGTWTARTDEYIVTAIATDIGVSIEASTAVLLAASPITIDQMPNIGDNGTTMREMLSVVGALRGGNWIINDDNELELITLSGNGTTIVVGDEVSDFDVSPTGTVKRVEVWAGSSTSFRSPADDGQGNPLSDDDWEAIGGTVLSVQMPIMGSQAVADALYAMYATSPNELVYIPYKGSSVYIDPDTPLGTALTIKNNTVLLASRSLNIDALGACDTSSDATQAATSYYPYLSPVEREIKQQTAENYAAITKLDDRIDSEVVDITDGYTSLVEQTAKDITDIFYDYESNVKKYIQFSAQGIEIGTEGSNLKTIVTDTDISFYGEDGQKAAWVSNTQLNISEAVIGTNQKFKGTTGNWIQEVRDNHFRIRWADN